MSNDSIPGSVVKNEILSILEEISGRYPEDVFPADGVSLDCASARFARNIIGQIKEKVIELCTEVENEMTPKELSDKLGIPGSTLWKRLHHRFCPKTRRSKGPTGRVISLEVTEELEKFLSQPSPANGVMLK